MSPTFHPWNMSVHATATTDEASWDMWPHQLQTIVKIAPSRCIFVDNQLNGYRVGKLKNPILYR